MRDLAFVGFLLALIFMGCKRPFVFVLAYVYVDIVSPQRLTYILLNSVPVSLILVCLAVGAWALFDDKRDTRFAPRQMLLIVLLAYCGMTTMQADFPLEAFEKWSWVWKALAFAIFLPLTLRTRLRIEALVLFMVLSAASIIIVGGIKTLAGGGGYGSLNLMMDSNSGLYEGSILSTVAIAIIPLIAWLARYGTIYVPDWRVRGFAAALAFACLLIPIGTQARTGLICIAVLGVTFLRQTKRRGLYLGAVAAAALITIPLLPASFTTRMDTIKGYQADTSASTRIAVWQWTIGYVKEHPFGGGFEAYRQNKLRIVKQGVATGEAQDTSTVIEYDQARAYHSSYFEMLGEQGYPGLILWLMIHVTGLLRMEIIRARYRKSVEDGWISGLAVALQQGHLIYLIGSLFVGIAFQPFVYMLVGLQIGLDTYASRRTREAKSDIGWRTSP
ncbi:MAG: putative O-glycosylation ligase, exosortase system-associated [Sphingomonadales bacterium]|nr:putative O-glycosylation ligase, exosortase system-associated [Sphingomonadales bacterium]